LIVIIIIIIFIIIVPSQQPQGQLQTQHSVDTNNYDMDDHNIKSKITIIHPVNMYIRLKRIGPAFPSYFMFKELRYHSSFTVVTVKVC
jgi:hypothetical protein